MASREAQVSAFISKTTRQLLESHVRATGEKKGPGIEIALRHYFLALQELPADIVIPPRIVASRDTGDPLLGEPIPGRQGRSDSHTIRVCGSRRRPRRGAEVPAGSSGSRGRASQSRCQPGGPGASGIQPFMPAPRMRRDRPRRAAGWARGVGPSSATRTRPLAHKGAPTGDAWPVGGRVPSGEATWTPPRGRPCSW